MMSKLFANLDTNTAAYGAFFLRVSLGVIFLAHGLMKLLVFTPAGTAQFFEAHGFPGWTAYPVMWIEIIGGAAMIVGLFTRLWALLFVPIMIGASLVHVSNGWTFSAPNGGWEYPVFLVVASLAQALIGEGAFALSSFFNTVRQTSFEPQRAVETIH